MTQQTKLTNALKRKWMTSGAIVELLQSTCPHKRISDLKRAGLKVDKRESKNPAFKFEYRIAA